jgi:nucleoid-associated protein YgaU
MSSVGTGTRAAAPAAASAAVASAQPQTPPSVPATTTYVVRPGDSLWKIFTSMRAQSGDRNGWMDFLSKTQSLNSLGDPDRLQPGKVLTFSSQE